MSGTPSDGRTSVSSEPSAASSHTLNSRYSGRFEDNGEGSSSQRPSRADSRPNSGRRNGVPASPSRKSGSPLGQESIEEHDFAQRRHRNRRSGGFLLDSSFTSGLETQQQHRHSAYVEDVKGKHSSRHGHRYDSVQRRGVLQARDGGSSNSSPLSREVRVLDQDGTGQNTRIDSSNVQEHNGELRLPKVRKSVHESQPAPAFLNRDSADIDPTPRPVVDTTQIVNMALNLSESRRRNLSAGQLITPQQTGSRRIASVATQPNGDFREYVAGNRLRQYFNDQRRVSRNISPFGGRSSPRQMSTSMPRSMSMSGHGLQSDPSGATLARRDKARAYIELRMEYLRILDLLPPLKPDASAPGNFVVTANNVPGSPNAYLTRTPSYAGKNHGLGRAYNPLQYLRNRRTRARERKALGHTPDEFLDIEQVRDWVDRVEKESQSPAYRHHDGVVLPKYHEDHDQGSSPSKPTRPHKGWFVTSDELLADAHWLEQDDNKTIVEDRHGRKLFPPKAELPKQDFLQPRASKEYPEKRRKSWIEGLPGIPADPTTGDESDQTSERGRKRRLLPAFRAESPKPKKHGWRGSELRSRSYSSPSDSDTDSQRSRSRKPRTVVDDVNSTGPLGLHLKGMMEKEAKEAKAISPAIVSPDTPDKWGVGHLDAVDSKASRSSMEAAAFPNGSVKEDSHTGFKMPPKRRTNQTLSVDLTRESRSSFEELDSTAPNTPLHRRQFPHIGSDLSPPPSRDGSVKKSKKSRLDMFRSDESARSSKYEPESPSSDNKRDSRQVSEEAAETSFGTAILSAPGAVKSLLLHRKNESVSSLGSPDHRKDHKEPKEPREPSSAVHRFFKGVKSEGSKVGEFIFRKDRSADDSDTEITQSDRVLNDSDTDEDTDNTERKHRPDHGRSTTSTTTGSVTTKKNGRYHIELPSFRSQNDPDRAYASDSRLSDDPITRQARARASDRSPRFDKLAPPRMDIGSMSATSTPSQSRSQSPDITRDRMNKIPARPGGVGQGGLPTTALAHPQRQVSHSSRPKLEKRHWSIADDNSNSLTRSTTALSVVTQSDIARVRALFLCSGIKAREIARRAHEKRVDPSKFLTRAAKAANAGLIPVPRKEEHVLAARILVRNLEASTSALHASASEFRNSTIKELASTISSLRSRVESDLFLRVRDSGDEAVRITSEVSATAPLSVKQISDGIDKMIRMRRRRMRWMRRVGWMLVEWLLLGVMWWAWLIVVMLGFVRRVFGFGWGVLRWLLWI